MRIVIIASLIAALSGAAYGADDSLEKAAKKTSDGFGNLLKGMGQEIKKAGIGDDGKKQESETKKDDKKPRAAVNPKEESK